MAQLWPLLSIFVLDISGIRTRVVRVVGEHADHLTTRYAPPRLDEILPQFHLLVEVDDERFSQFLHFFLNLSAAGARLIFI